MDAVKTTGEHAWRPGHSALPPEAQLDMPAQSLSWSPPGRKAPSTNHRAIGLRRAIVLGSTMVLTAIAAYQMYLVVTVNGPTTLQVIVLCLYVALFGWIAFSFVTMSIGFLVHAVGSRSPLVTRLEDPLPKIRSRSALLIPTYNEAPHRLFARVQAVRESIETTGQNDKFDFFILSDTTDPEIWIAEESAYLELRDTTGGGPVFYRHRTNNEGRKAGNIADWIRRFGAAYHFMIVLDADSLMTGDTIVRLVDAMERHPSTGLIQTLPIIVNAQTLFARLQQFAGRVYGPLVAHGIAWWHGAEGNYWGHNAIIRVRAFAECAGLPTLRGRKPFGGPILSHDFVEAALMRRNGWAINFAPELGGSYEEAPPSLDAYAIRDRRWCQGNLQHVGVLPAKGLHWMSRLHLLTGIGSYITSPMWLCFLVLGMLISLQAHFIRPEYFAPGFSLFPRWPTEDPYRAALVFSGTMAILIIPKLLGFITFVVSSHGRLRLAGHLASLLSEIIIAGLLAPVMMWKQTMAVVEIVLGRDAGWSAQQREGVSAPVKETLRRYSGPTGLGVFLAVAAYGVSLPLLLWMSPVIVGLLLAIPLAWLTGSAACGRAARRLGLLTIPEERIQPTIVSRSEELTTMRAAATETGLQLWHRLLQDAELSALHRDMLACPRPVERRQINTDLVVGLAKLDQCDAIDEALDILTSSEKRALLGNRTAFDRLQKLQQ